MTDAGEMPNNKGMFFMENFAPHGELLAKPEILQHYIMFYKAKLSAIIYVQLPSPAFSENNYSLSAFHVPV